MKDAKEKVLCISRKDLPHHWLKTMGSTALGPEEFFGSLKAAKLHWLEREEAEQNRSFKQIIPYVIFRNREKNLLACYRRNGGEKRLNNLWSLGIGGHINPVDTFDKDGSLASLVEAGLFREILEETGISGRNQHPEFLGVINEETTEVGKVHFGLVYSAEIENPEVFNPSDELSSFQWIKMPAARNLKMEHWSGLAMDLLSGP